MTVRTYRVKKSGDDRLSGNFRVKEFASHDGADAVLIDDDLVYILQRIRDHFRRPVTISRGYRTPAYNSSIGGSGSTMIACEQLKRNCRTMELDPKYCDVIIKRWETLTGKKAVKFDNF